MTRVLRAKVNEFSELCWLEPSYMLKARLLKQLTGCDVDVTITKHRETMSGRSKRYYWFLVTVLADHVGEEGEDGKDRVHEGLAWNFLKIDDDPVFGTPRRKHLPELDSPEGAKYIDQCVRKAAEYGCYIPSPGEVVA